MKVFSILTILLTIFNIFVAKAQLKDVADYLRFYEQSSTITPARPLTTDSISIMLNIWSPSNSRKLTGPEVKINGKNIEARACFAGSIASKPVDLSETFNFTHLSPGRYTLSFIAYNGNYDCIFKDSVVFTYKFEVFDASALIIYPNPSSGDLYLNYYSRKVEDIRLTDMSGRSMMQFEPSLRHLDISTLSRGTYILAIKTDTEMIRQKIVKQ